MISNRKKALNIFTYNKEVQLMAYELITCLVCGAKEIKKEGAEEKDGQVFGLYRCLACDAKLSAYEKYQKSVHKQVDENKTVGGGESVASTIYKNTVNKTVALFASVENGSKVGTGILISEKGYLITNAHVVMDFDKDKSILAVSDEIYGEIGENGYKFIAELIYANPDLDLAILKADCEMVAETVVFSKKETIPGEPIYAIGNNRGDGLCIVEGIVSDIHRKVGGVEYILISAPVTQGSSGGPVFNKEGELIGVVKGSRTDERLMNYVIPTRTVLAFLNEAREKEEFAL